MSAKLTAPLLATVMVVAAPTAAKTKKVSGFAAKEAAGTEVCRVCGHLLGSKECCRLPCPKMVFQRLEKAGIPAGPGRVAAVKAAKAAQKEAGLGGPAYSRACLDAAMAAAQATATATATATAKPAPSLLSRLQAARAARASAASAHQAEVEQALAQGYSMEEITHVLETD